MNRQPSQAEHERCLDLAAASIDFQLSPEEQQVLRSHLAICDSCSLTVRGMRDDATRLAAAPHPAAPAAVRDAVFGAATRRSGPRSGLRWPLIATALALTLLAGAYVAGAMVDRFRGPVQPAPTLPTTVVRTSPAPLPSTASNLRAGWQDLGDLGDAFGGRSVVSIMAGPDGRLVAFGLERSTADPLVWVSDDGVTWEAVAQPSGVFGGSVPTSGALGGAGMLVVASDISVEAGQQRAIWGSADGRTWSRSPDASALLGTTREDLTMTAGPAGIIVWAPSGKVWVSSDGRKWDAGSIGQQGITDMTVDGDRFIAVGQSGSSAFLVTSTDGTTWGSPQRTNAATGTQVGIERSEDGAETIWVGTQPFQRSGSSWGPASGSSVPRVPTPASIVGGTSGLGAFGSPTSADAYRAWTWDGSGDWVAERSDAESGSGAPTVVGVAAHDDGWFVLTRRGSALHGWHVAP